MKLRNVLYFRRQKAIRQMIQFRDLRSFLMAGLEASHSLVVKRDILSTLTGLGLRSNPALAS